MVGCIGCVVLLGEGFGFSTLA